MGFNDFWINNNGKKEQLGEVKHGVRKEQVDKKYHNLFDAYDSNKDGTLETSELGGIFSGLSKFAGEDKILDSKENDLAMSLFAGQSAIKDADFMGFVKSVSDSSADIISSEEKELPNGEKEIKTQYKDGTTETIVYYADGGFKYKKIDKKFSETIYEIEYNGRKQKINKEQFNKVLKEIDRRAKESKKPTPVTRGLDGQVWMNIQQPQDNIKANKRTNTWEDHKTENSDRYEIETVLKDLGLDLNSEDGKKISERLSKLPLDTLHEINKEDLKSLIKDNELEPTFDNVSNVLELVYGVTLRTDEEFKANQPKLEKIVNQIQSAALLQNLCELVSTWNDQYTDSIGLFGMGSEGIGYLTNKLGKLFGADWGSNHYQMADAYKGYAENVAKLPVLNPEKFAEKFSNVYGEDTKGNFKYDEQAFKKLFDLVQQEKAYKKDENGNVIEITDEFKDVMAKAVNFTADNPNESMYNSVMNGLGEALIMIMTLGWAAEAKGGQMLATSTIGTFSKLGAGIAAKQVNNKLLQGALRFTGKGVKLIGPALNEGTKMATYTLATGTATNIFNRGIKFDQENTVEKFLQEEARIGDATVSSFEFGAFAGVFGSTVTQKVLQKVQGVSSKVTSALSKNFAKGSVEAGDVYTTILEKSVPEKLVEKGASEVAAFCTDVIGFTAFETAQTIVKNLGSEELTPKNIEKLLWKEFKDQGYNLGQIKLVSWMLGSRGARTQSMKYLKDSFPQLKGATVEQNGKGYKINLADGRKIECKNANEMIASLHLMARNETAFSSKFDVKQDVKKGQVETPMTHVQEAKDVVVEQDVKPETILQVDEKAGKTVSEPKPEEKTSELKPTIENDVKKSSLDPKKDIITEAPTIETKIDTQELTSKQKVENESKPIQDNLVDEIITSILESNEEYQAIKAKYTEEMLSKYSKLSKGKLRDIESWSKDDFFYEVKELSIPKEARKILEKYIIAETFEHIRDRVKQSLPNMRDLDILNGASMKLKSSQQVRNRQISDLRYSIRVTLENNSIPKDKVEEILSRFEDVTDDITTNKLSLLREYIAKNEKKFLANLDFDFTQIENRNLKDVNGQNLDYTIAGELLFCSDAEYEQKRSRYEQYHEFIDSNNYVRILNLPQESFDKISTNVEDRTHDTPFNVDEYKNKIKQKIEDPIVYDPDEAYKFIQQASKMVDFPTFGGRSNTKPTKYCPFETLKTKQPVGVVPLTSGKELIKTLNETGLCEISILNEGGAKPVMDEKPVIHPSDVERLGEVENAGITIRYGKKTNWNNIKIARDIMQNFYDGNGHTLEGVDIKVERTEDGKYKVRVEGLANYDYSHLETLGDSTKDGNAENAGAFGEGTRIVAVNLLANKGTTNVRYASGDWQLDFGKSSEDISSSHMTQTLTKSKTTQKGNYLEFDTTDSELVRKILDSKDYFYHPHNPDFQNLSFENEYFGFKILPESNDKGNIYIVQRYETNGVETGGLNNATFVFKKMPNDDVLKQRTGSELSLGTGRDRVNLRTSQIQELIEYYSKTMSDEELTQTISSLDMMWKDETKKDYNNSKFILEAFINEAKNRRLGIDFNDQYVYVRDNNPVGIQTAKAFGYNVADEIMSTIGMHEYVDKYATDSDAKKPYSPTASQSKMMRLLDEGVKIIQENTDLRTMSLITEDEVYAPRFIFGNGGSPNEGAEAIINSGKYVGHWMKDSYLATQDYFENLATYLHEISHKQGGDNSKEFSIQMQKMQKLIINSLSHNPEALAKLNALSEMFADAQKEVFINDKNEAYTKEAALKKVFKALGTKNTPEVTTNTPLSIESYEKNIQSRLDETIEYKEYVEDLDNRDNRKATTSTTEEISLSASSISLKPQFRSFEDNRTMGQKIVGGLKKIFTKDWILKAKTSSSRRDGGKLHFGTQTPEIKYEYKTTPIIQKAETTKLKPVEELLSSLMEEGHIKFEIQNEGGLNPINTEVPEIHHEDIPKLDKVKDAHITIRYGAKTNWSNEKIARDIMQNFYDGNGHTMEGVGLDIKRNENGTYSVKITGKGVYDYKHLETIGDSTKDGNAENAGAFGEGTRIVAVNLLANKGTSNVKYASGDWEMTFGKDSEDVMTSHMTQKLSKSSANFEGNYLEFDTTDENLVKRLLESRDYFYHPSNPDFQNMTFENEFFGFKVLPNENGNLYYVQRYEAGDADMTGGMRKLSVAFKQGLTAEELKKKIGYSIDLSTGRDRVAISPSDMAELAYAYAKTLSNDELVSTITSLEPILITRKPIEDSLDGKSNDMSKQFVVGLIREAAHRNIKIDFSKEKIVARDSYPQKMISPEMHYLSTHGYRFADNIYRQIGMLSIDREYAEIHKVRSLKPTKAEDNKLKVLKEAVNLFAETQDPNFKLPNMDKIGMYIFDSSISNNPKVHSTYKEGKCDGIFLDRVALEKTSFMDALNDVISIAIKENKTFALESSKYSYDLTDLISSEMSKLVKDPQVAQKIRILERLYNEN